MNAPTLPAAVRAAFRLGQVIPAMPLALNAARGLDERRQRALIRYYIAAGAGGLAVGVHTTQFAVRDTAVGLFAPVLRLASELLQEEASSSFMRIAGICGDTEQAVDEATIAARMGYHAGLVSLAVFQKTEDEALIAHCRAIAAIIPVVGFYLQPSVGGRVLDYSFWRRFAEIEGAVGIKVAPFNRYQTIDVMRAVAEAGRVNDMALYTGNDDNIVLDLLTRYRFDVGSRRVEIGFAGGLLGHWAVWTRQAVALLGRCRSLAHGAVPIDMLTLAAEITDSNAAFFDAANSFSGCIPGIHEVLRRQGLLEGIWCIDPRETLSTGQMEEINRVYSCYPHLNDDAFVAEYLDHWFD